MSRGLASLTRRCVEWDISALQQAGTPIYVKPGRSGGYVLDRAHTLPPLNITPWEAIAVVVAGLRRRFRATPAGVLDRYLHRARW
jgi:predicted DNA-binding transcriptional regulator YafY